MHRRRAEPLPRRVSRPDRRTYRHLLDLVCRVREDPSDLAPRDLIDVQSFLWVLGSDEYP